MIVRESRIEDTSYRDLITIALMGFVMITILLILLLNPPATEDTPATDTGLKIELSWPHEMDVDVDLWVKTPGGEVVGYSNLGGIVANLIRDDLGTHNDPGFTNHETVRTRGFVAGSYIINVHLFTNRTSFSEIPVSIQIVHEEIGSRAKELYSVRTVLTFQGQELTIVRFDLTETGDIVPGSIHSVPIKIRSNKGSPN